MLKQFCLGIIFFSFHLVTAQSGSKMFLNIDFVQADECLPTDSIKYKKYHRDSLSVIREIYKIKNNAVAQGYVFANIDSLAITDTAAYAVFYTGHKYNTASLKISSPNEIPLSRTFRKKQKLTISDFIEYKDLVLEYYENNGYPFAQIKIDSIILEAGLLGGNIVVDKGFPVSIDSIIIFGDNNTNETLLFNSIDIFPNDSYSEKKIRQIRSKIDKLPYVSAYRKPEIIFNSDLTVSIHIFLEKEKANRFDGFIGFANSDETGKLEFTGKVTISLLNSLGQGELLNMEWQKIKSLSQKLYFAGEYPYLFKTKIGALGSFFIKRQDSSYVSIDYSVGTQYYINSRNKFSVAYRKKTSQLGTINTTQLTKLPPNIDYEINLMELGMTVQQLDFLLNPRNGFYSKLTLSGGKKEIFKNSQIPDSLYEPIALNTEYGDITLQTEYYIPLFKNQVLSLQNQTAYVYSSSLFRNELLEFGGTSSLRGFDEDALLASFYVIFTVEYRFLIGKISNVYAFYDQAYYQTKANAAFVEDTPFGFGLGIQLGSKTGVFTLSYALGKQFDNSLSFSSGKVHIGYINKF